MATTSLSSHLLSLKSTASYSDATEHPFLTLAGTGDLPIARLALWLSQDRIYAAHAYPRFIGALISHIPFHVNDPINGSAEKLKQDILHILVQCLDNILIEVKFFHNTARDFGLDLEGWLERKETRDYTAEMSRVAWSSTLEEGIIFLWAMEKVYFDAWSYVKKLQQSGPADLLSKPSTAAVEKFSSNWSTPEFGAFVDSLGELVDKFCITPGTEEWSRAELIWKRVVELEVGFWPSEGEEISQRKISSL